MEALLKCSVVIISVFTLLGCSTLVTTKAEPGSVPEVVRIYPNKVYLFVAKEKLSIIHLPDFDNAYDIKPMTFFSKQDFAIKLEGGQLTELTANQDTTSILSFLGGMAKLGAGAAGVGPVSAEVLTGKFGLEPGIYTLEANGVLKKIK